MKTKSGKREKASPVKREKAKSRLSHILSGKGANNGQFERGQLVQLILTKAVFACERLWW